MLVRPLMNDFKMTVRADCTVFTCSPIPQPIQAFATDCQWRGTGSWTGVDLLPLSTSSKIKQPFLSYQLLRIGFQAVKPPDLDSVTPQLLTS